MNKIDKIQQICNNLMEYYVKGHVTWYKDMPTSSILIFIDTAGIRYMHTLSLESFAADNWMEVCIDNIVKDYNLWLRSLFFKEL